MYCPNCGQAVEPEGARFCPACGQRIESSEHVSDTATPLEHRPTPEGGHEDAPTADAAPSVERPHEGTPSARVLVDIDVDEIDGGEVTGVEVQYVDGDVEITRITTEPSELEVVGRFLTTHWPAILCLLVVIAAIAVAYIWARPRYLVDPRAALAAVALATVAVLALWAAVRSKAAKMRPRLLATAALLVLLNVGLWQGRTIADRQPMAPDAFGIAIAHFDYDTGLRGLRLAESVTAHITNALDKARREEDTWAFVDVRRVGLVRNQQEAAERGKQVGADLLIWGDVSLIGTGGLEIGFSVIETSDRATSPVSPHVIPATQQFVRASAQTDLTPTEIQDAAAAQARAIIAFTLGVAAYYQGDYAAARDQFLAAAAAVTARGADAENHDQTALVYYYLGRSYQRLGDLETGAEHLVHARQHAAHDPAMPLSLAYGHNSLGQMGKKELLANEAIDLATDQLMSHPDALGMRYDRALANMLVGRYERTARELDIVLEADPEFYVAYLVASEAYLRAKDTDRAIERARQGIAQAERAGGDSSWGHLYLGNALDAADDVDGASEHYERAIDLAPEVDWMHFVAGVFHDRRGNPERAKQAFDRMLAVTRDVPWALSTRAAFVRRQGRLEEAILDYERVLIERPGDILSQVYLAELYLEVGRTAKGRETFEDALVQDTALQYGWASYGRALLGLQAHARAIEVLTRALELSPGDCVSRYNLGLSLAGDGQTDLARQAWERIVDGDPASCSDELVGAARDRLAGLTESDPSVTDTKPPQTTAHTHTPAARTTAVITRGPTATPVALPPTLTATAPPAATATRPAASTPTTTMRVLPSPTTQTPTQPPGISRRIVLGGELAALQRNGAFVWPAIGIEYFDAQGHALGLIDCRTVDWAYSLPPDTHTVRLWIGPGLGGASWWQMHDSQPASAAQAVIALDIRTLPTPTSTLASPATLTATPRPAGVSTPTVGPPLPAPTPSATSTPTRAPTATDTPPQPPTVTATATVAASCTPTDTPPAPPTPTPTATGTAAWRPGVTTPTQTEAPHPTMERRTTESP